MRPLYRDPVHDFGFYRFDPRALKFMKCAEIPLNPTGNFGDCTDRYILHPYFRYHITQGARIGAEIRVVGNDAGEQLSIVRAEMFVLWDLRVFQVDRISLLILPLFHTFPPANSTPSSRAHLRVSIAQLRRMAQETTVTSTHSTTKLRRARVVVVAVRRFLMCVDKLLH